MAKPIPTHPEGWKFKGRAGAFHVWHAGKNDYRVTRGADGAALGTRTQFGDAWSMATRLESTHKAIDAYYTDRANSGLAALST